jgi:hypothetical protein
MHYLFEDLLFLRQGLRAAYAEMYYAQQQMKRRRRRFESLKRQLTTQIEKFRDEHRKLSAQSKEALTETVEAFFNDQLPEARQAFARAKELQERGTALPYQWGRLNAQIRASDQEWRQYRRFFRKAARNYCDWLMTLRECERSIAAMLDIPSKDWDDSGHIRILFNERTGNGRVDIFFGGFQPRPFGSGHAHYVADLDGTLQWRREPYEDTGTRVLSG